MRVINAMETRPFIIFFIFPTSRPLNYGNIKSGRTFEDAKKALKEEPSAYCNDPGFFGPYRGIDYFYKTFKITEK